MESQVSKSLLQQAITEEDCFNIAKESLMGFTQVTKPDYITCKFHVDLSDKLEMVESGEIKKLMVIAPPRHGKCLDANTPIWTEDGDKTIEEISVGQVIYCIDSNGMPGRDVVQEKEFTGKQEAYEIVAENGASLILTENHTLLTDEGWRSMIGRGDHIATKPDGPKQEGIELSEVIEKNDLGKSETYDIQTKRFGNFLANGIVSHNSELCSKRFPAWCLGRDPGRQIIQASHAADLSEEFSHETRDIVKNDPIFKEVFPNSRVHPQRRAVEQWSTTEGGYYLAKGVGGSITGKGADIAIVDDPHKDWATSHSQAEKDKVWNWFQSTLSTRMSSNGAIVLILTRWARDDLAGRLLEHEPDEWDIMHCPAIDDNGDALCPELYSIEELKEIRDSKPLRIWLSLYQGRPMDVEGKEMDMDWFNYMEEDEVPENIRWCRGWDLAFTKKRYSSKTSSVKMGYDKENGRFILKDFISGKWEWRNVKELVKEYAKKEKCTVAVGTGGTQKKDLDEIKEELRGDVTQGMIKSMSEQAGKEARIRRWATKVESGSFYLVTDGSNWDDLLYEAHHFPDVKIDALDSVSNCFDYFVEETSSAGPSAAKPTEIKKNSKWRM